MSRLEGSPVVGGEAISPPTSGVPKLFFEAEFVTETERDRVHDRIRAKAAARQGGLGSESREQAEGGRHAARGELNFAARGGRDACKTEVISELEAAAGLYRAHVHWHDCGENEPEPTHLPYEHIEYQTWRATRNCRERNFGEVVIGG